MITKQDHGEAAAFVAANPPAPRFYVCRADSGGLYEIWQADGGRVSIWTNKADADHMCGVYNRAATAKGRWDQ